MRCSAAGFAEQLASFSLTDLAAIVASLERRVAHIDEQLAGGGWAPATRPGGPAPSG
ncbi:hypothetical protein [Tautonia marina]|uniref:hypothetical protein n=1 Tax=Tautonia marina TaxID=2653855 RepID=UPI001375AEA8|nr:hypothetical protein [Tautonia marina]